MPWLCTAPSSTSPPTEDQTTSLYLQARTEQETLRDLEQAKLHADFTVSWNENETKPSPAFKVQTDRNLKDRACHITLEKAADNAIMPSQVVRSSFSRNWTVTLPGMGRDGRNLPGGWLVIQLSVKIIILLPSPTAHLIPFRTNSLANRILYQTYNEELGRCALENSPSGKYLARRTLAHWEVGAVRSRQLFWPSIAWLNVTTHEILSARTTHTQWLGVDRHSQLCHVSVASMGVCTEEMHSLLKLGDSTSEWKKCCRTQVDIFWYHPARSCT